METKILYRNVNGKEQLFLNGEELSLRKFLDMFFTDEKEESFIDTYLNNVALIDDDVVDNAMNMLSDNYCIEKYMSLLNKDNHNPTELAILSDFIDDAKLALKIEIDNKIEFLNELRDKL